MARARNIKPSFFMNEVLAQCSPHARLMFVGLWTLADREGRLEDRPMRIKAQLFPYENVDAEALLNELQGGGFIYRYVAKFPYIQILNFEKHQCPHVKEGASTIPAPDLSDANLSDSPFLIPDSPFPHQDNPKKDYSSSGTPADCPHQAIIDLYHETLPMLPRVREWTPARALQLRTRWREDPERQTLDYWQRFFEYVKTSDFLCGRVTPAKGKKPFLADLEWLTKSANFTKVREGKYDNG